MDKKRLGLWAPILVLAAALVMLAVSTGAVDAARGGKGGGKPGGSNGVTLTASPNPLPAGTVVTFNGSGFRGGETLLVGVLGYVPWADVTTDGSGAFSHAFTRTTDPTVFPPGTYYVQAKRSTNQGMVTVASTSFTVVP